MAWLQAYTKSHWSEPMRPVVHSDGHDAPRHFDQPVPVEAAETDDVVVASEHPVG